MGPVLSITRQLFPGAVRVKIMQFEYFRKFSGIIKRRFSGFCSASHEDVRKQLNPSWSREPLVVGKRSPRSVVLNPEHLESLCDSLQS